MMFGLAHVVRQIHSVVREAIKRISRSPEWPRVRREFLKTHSACAACGGKTLLQVHHCNPFHLDPKLELDPNNLITLCMGKFECHLKIGHGDDFKAYNPDVRADAALVLRNPAQRSLTEQKAKNNRTYVEGGAG